MSSLNPTPPALEAEPYRWLVQIVDASGNAIGESCSQVLVAASEHDFPGMGLMRKVVTPLYRAAPVEPPHA